MHIEMIGSPLNHVRSPDRLNAMFRARGDKIEVTTSEVRLPDLQAFAARMREDASAIGLIVTTPLKQAIIGYLAEQTALVSLLGASNCVRFDQSGWLGANFDGHGFVAALAALGPRDFHGKRVLVVGCGGAGSAIAASLLQLADIRLLLHDAENAKAAALAASLAAFAPGREIGVINRPYGAFDLVVNATPVGMGEDDPSPIPPATVASAAIVADIVTVSDTALKLMATELHKPVVTGDAMVAGQAALLRRFLLGGARTELEVVSAENR